MARLHRSYKLEWASALLMPWLPNPRLVYSWENRNPRILYMECLRNRQNRFENVRNLIKNKFVLVALINHNIMLHGIIFVPSPSVTTPANLTPGVIRLTLPPCLRSPPNCIGPFAFVAMGSESISQSNCSQLISFRF